MLKTYIEGHYISSDKELDVLKAPSNRKILEKLRMKYPEGMTANDLVDTNIGGESTIRGNLPKQLEKESFIKKLEEKKLIRKEKGKRLRPNYQYIIEDFSSTARSVFHSPFPLAPGNVKFSDDFMNGLKRVIDRQDEKDLYEQLRRYIDKVLRLTINETQDEAVKKIAPVISEEMLCSNCGFNHEARDFIRMVLLNLIDRLETNVEFIELLKGQKLITDDAAKMMELSSHLTTEEKSKEITKPAMIHEGSQIKQQLTEVEPTTIILRILCIQKDYILHTSFSVHLKQKWVHR